MKKILLASGIVGLSLLLAACDEPKPVAVVTPQVQQAPAQPQVVYEQAPQQQPQVVVVQQPPTQVVQQQPHYDSSGHLITGMALGYLAGKSHSAPAPRTVYRNKTVVVKKYYPAPRSSSYGRPSLRSFRRR